MKNEHDPPIADFDARIKRAIEVMHEFFMRLFFPRLSLQLIFPEKAPSMDKELQKIFADWEKLGWTLCDKLFGYQTLDGDKHLVLIHIEAHGGDEAAFKKLQFMRFYRLLEKFPDAKITQLVLYIGDTVPPRPFEYRLEFEGTLTIHRFNIYLVKKQKRRILQQLSKVNPFALVILALLENLATKDDGERRRKTKLRLMRLCLESPFRDLIRELLIFVEFTIALPKDEEIIYREEIDLIMNTNQPVEPSVFTHPDNPLMMAAQHLVFKGKTYREFIEERENEREKERQREILTMHQLGIEVEKIALIKKVEKKYVEQVIAESRNKAEA
ncbi:MAG: hypothetical protein AAB316_24660 [Bacteroidota bacterium]